jgi:hypothetical protein
MLNELQKQEYHQANVLFFHTGGLYSCWQSPLLDRLNRLSNQQHVGSIQMMSLPSSQ